MIYYILYTPQALCDRDPSVMAVTLPAITGMTASDTGIANSLITILVQVREGRGVFYEFGKGNGDFIFGPK